jgi:hypothetical protein
MKNEEYKSLMEVWEMKDSVWNDFLKSGLSSYSEFIRNDVKEITKKFNLNIWYVSEKEKVN